MTLFQKQERYTINSQFQTLASRVTQAPSCQAIVKISANKQRFVIDKNLNHRLARSVAMSIGMLLGR